MDRYSTHLSIRGNETFVIDDVSGRTMCVCPDANHQADAERIAALLNQEVLDGAWKEPLESDSG